MIGHGWVHPDPSGIRVKCGGPALCKVCKQEVELDLRRASPILRAEVGGETLAVSYSEIANEAGEFIECAVVGFDLIGRGVSRHRNQALSYALEALAKGVLQGS